eukprot:8371257-Pyramimonas_sp.AAC.2
MPPRGVGASSESPQLENSTHPTSRRLTSTWAEAEEPDEASYSESASLESALVTPAEYGDPHNKESKGSAQAALTMGVDHSEFHGPYSTQTDLDGAVQAARDLDASGQSAGVEGPFLIGVGRKDHLESEHSYHVRARR